MAETPGTTDFAAPSIVQPERLGPQPVGFLRLRPTAGAVPFAPSNGVLGAHEEVRGARDGAEPAVVSWPGVQTCEAAQTNRRP